MDTVKKIEIITSSLEMQQVLEILEKAGVSWYTLIDNVVSKGDRGRVINDLETRVLSNGYVMSVCTEAQTQKLVTEIRPILQKFGGVCIDSDVKCIAH